MLLTTEMHSGAIHCIFFKGIKVFEFYLSPFIFFCCTSYGTTQYNLCIVLKQCIYSSTVLIPSLFVNTIKGRKKFRGGKKNSRQFEKLCK